MFLAYIAISLLISLVAAELLRPDPPKQDPLKDDSINTAHVRGTMLPILLGYNKVTPIIGYVGNRSTWEKKVGEIDGGMFHSDESIKETRYIESGLHFLCVGPAYRLNKITEGGNIIFDTTITPATHPSGTDLTCLDDFSVFRIYWGEHGQPVDPYLAAITGVASRYPYTCYIYWTRKDLGTQATWKNIEYYLECSALDKESEYFYTQDSSYEIPVEREGDFLSTTDDTILNAVAGDSLTFMGEELTISSVTAGASFHTIVTTPMPTPKAIAVACNRYGCYPVGAVPDDPTGTVEWLHSRRVGVNPASAIEQLLFEPYPHGLGAPSTVYSSSDLITLKDYFAEGGTEPSPCTLYNKQGETISNMISKIMADYGILLFPDAETGQYRFKLLRAGETPYEIGKDFFNESDARQSVSHNVLAPDKIMYSFSDAFRSFQSSTIVVSDDGNAKLSGDPNTKKQTINTATDLLTASIIASRMDQGFSTSEGIRITVSSDLALREVGDLITLEGQRGVYRIASKKENPGDSGIEMALAQDVYSVENNYTSFAPTGASAPLPLVPDASVALMETNRFLHPDTAGYYVIRARGASHIPFASLYRSTDGTKYSSIQSLDYQTACSLSNDLGDDIGTMLDTIEVESLGRDFAAFWSNVALTDGEWRSGAVGMVIGSEYFFPKSITDNGGGSFTLNDVIRGRFGSGISSHSAGDVASLFYRNSIPLIEDSTLMAGVTLYVRTRPYSSIEVLPLEYNEVQTLDYQGGGFRPLQPSNLTTGDWTSAWIAGEDIDLVWGYKNASSVSGAGISVSDVATEQSGPEGYFRLEILNGTTVVRTVNAISLGNYTYSNADMVSDFGTEPSSINVRVLEIFNGLTSPAEEVTITRV